jgi:hypothetical protein
MTAVAGTITIITWWLEVGALAFTGGIAIGLGVSWLFCPQDPAAQVEPSAPGEWPPILGALAATGKNETAFSISRGIGEGENYTSVRRLRHALATRWQAVQAMFRHLA